MKPLMSQILMSHHTTLQMTGTFVNFLITLPLVGVMLDLIMTPRITPVMTMGRLVRSMGQLTDIIMAAIPLLRRIFCQENCQMEGAKSFSGKNGG